MDKVEQRAEAQPDWEAAPPGATHYQPHQDAYYKRVSASEWYVWSRVEDRELLRWLPSPGTSDSAEWVVRPTDAHPPPSATVGVELAALRVQEWLHREHDILPPVQEIEQAMRTPCSCPFTERALDPPPAAVDEAAAIRAFEEHFEASAEDPSFEGELELWLTAWRKALDSAPQQPAAVDGAMVERIAALLHEEATAEPWTVAGVEHPGPDRDYYRGLASKVAALITQQQGGRADG